MAELEEIFSTVQNSAESAGDSVSAGVSGGVAAIAGSADLPRLFEEFSRVTAELSASHDTLLEQVESMKQELEFKNKELERKKRLEALGRVAAGVAHEFRNPLGSMQLTVDALLGDAPTDRSRARLGHVQKAIRHLGCIVNDLLLFTRNDRIRKKAQRVSELVRDSMQMAFACEGPEQPLVEIVGPPELCISCDRQTLIQVLVNLFVNAEQAQAKGCARIRVSWGIHRQQNWLEVADAGLGIEAGEEERIFHPFHSLREGGTGLGLAIVHSRIEAHGGEVAVVYDPWGGGEALGGACFRILLPNENFDVKEAT